MAEMIEITRPLFSLRLDGTTRSLLKWGKTVVQWVKRLIKPPIRKLLSLGRYLGYSSLSVLCRNMWRPARTFSFESRAETWRLDRLVQVEVSSVDGDE
jgi:hypothetical protein